MTDLRYKKCKPCEGGVKPLTPDEYGAFLRKELQGWEVLEEKKLHKKYLFKNFTQALGFANKIGALAEEEGHHPDLCLGWGYVDVTLTTHAISGLSENDLIMGAKIDSL